MPKPAYGTAGVLILFVILYFAFQGLFGGTHTQTSAASVQPTLTEIQPIAPNHNEAASCIAQANANYPVEWANACYTSNDGLARFLENCQLSQSDEDRVDLDRLNAIQTCYNQQ